MITGEKMQNQMCGPEKEDMKMDVRGGLIEEMVSCIKEELKGKIISIALFGSFARGSPEKNSDIDLLLVGDFEGSFGKRNAFLSPLYLKVRRKYEYLSKDGYSVCIQFYPLSPEEIRKHPPIMLDMVEDAKLLFDANNFLRNELEIIRKTLRELGSKRIFIDKNRWYWRLHPQGKEVTI